MNLRESAAGVLALEEDRALGDAGIEGGRDASTLELLPDRGVWAGQVVSYEQVRFAGGGDVLAVPVHAGGVGHFGYGGVAYWAFAGVARCRWWGERAEEQRTQQYAKQTMNSSAWPG